MKILITPRGFASYGLNQIEWLRQKGYTVHYNNTGKAYSHEEFLDLAKDMDAIIVGVDSLDRAAMKQCPHLKVICKFGVGTDNIDTDYAKEKGILVGRTVGSNANSVAEHVMALLYSEAKNIVQSVTEVRAHQWQKPTGREIYRKALGIVGFGAIGRQLARQAVGAGMVVNVYDAAEIEDTLLAEYGVHKAGWDEIISGSDYISLHLPLTESTRNIISSAELKKMKADACLINTARGGIVDEAALYEALKNKEIRSACFDVFSTEPPLADERLLTLPNFYLTAHIAARTIEAEKKACEISSEIIAAELEKRQI